jgi:hypothetical protein
MLRRDITPPGVPDQKAFEIGLNLIPTPAEIEFTVNKNYLSLALFLWTCLRSKLDEVGYVPCGTTSNPRYKDGLLEHATLVLYKLGWDARQGRLTQDKKKIIFRLMRNLTDDAMVRSGDRCYIPTPEQLKHMQLPHNESLLFAIWVFVQAILEGHNTVRFGTVPGVLMTDKVREKAMSIVSHRGWRVQEEITHVKGREDSLLRIVPSGRIVAPRRIV